MRIPSVYNVYREFFGYPKSSKPRISRLFAFSINDAHNVLRQVCLQRCITPIEQYEAQQKKCALSSKFLGNAKNLLNGINLDKLIYINGKIWVESYHLKPNLRGGITILLPYIINQETNEVINLSFGRPEVIDNELRVLKGLWSYFEITAVWPSEYEQFVYWDLCKSTQSRANFSKIKPVSKESLLRVLNRMVA